MSNPLHVALNKRHPAIWPALITAIYLLILFLCVLSYFYGALFQDGSKIHNLRVLAVNYDDGALGESLQGTYRHLQSPEFITLVFRPAASVPVSVLQQSMCQEGYWGAIYTAAGSTQQFLSALNGDISANGLANAINIVSCSIHYPVVVEAYIMPQLQELSSAAVQVLFTSNRTDNASSGKQPSLSSAFDVFSHLQPNIIELTPITSGARVLLNTVTMVAPPLMQFFYIMAIDHISLATHAFQRIRWSTLYLTRLLAAKLYGFLSALIVTGVIFAFRESWDLSVAQFFETWACFWFYMDICYQVMDTFIGSVVPMRFAPFFIFSWVIVGISSTLFPFELSPGFYKWGYALPAHDIWLLLMQIWSHGCVNQLRVALPVLFMWFLFGHVASAFALRRKIALAQPKTLAASLSPETVSPVKESIKSENQL